MADKKITRYVKISKNIRLAIGYDEEQKVYYIQTEEHQGNKHWGLLGTPTYWDVATAEIVLRAIAGISDYYIMLEKY
jgi:membrane protease subunit (stomatin/prohibitin family)